MKPLYLLPIFLTSTILAQEPDSTSALFKMREAERNFARASVMMGRNAAFFENFAEESVLFTDKWISNGKQFSKERKSAPIVLKWEPEYMDIAESRDFGISTGPWEVQEYRPNTAPLATGYFLTVWKKQPNGDWKVILDGGSETPPVKRSDNFTFPPGADKTGRGSQKYNAQQLTKELLEMEIIFQKEWKKSPLPATFCSFLSPSSRMQINGHLPSTNTDSIKIWISKFDKNIKWQASGAGAATSGDMGYTYGIMSREDKSALIKGHYVRIWKKKPGRDWKIVLEMLNWNKT